MAKCAGTTSPTTADDDEARYLDEKRQDERQRQKNIALAKQIAVLTGGTLLKQCSVPPDQLHKYMQHSARCPKLHRGAEKAVDGFFKQGPPFSPMMQLLAAMISSAVAFKQKESSNDDGVNH